MKLKYSQNFLRDPLLIERLICKSSLSKDDTVVEIGAGKGVITAQLIKRCKYIIAYEADNRLIDELRNKYTMVKNLELCEKDFLFSQLPEVEYKVFSNIPFNITADIMRKLFNNDNPPVDSYLIMQKEAALKFSGIIHETLFSVLHKPWFSFEIIHHFQRSDFIPTPAVDVVTLRAIKLENPLFSESHAIVFKDFATYGFTSVRENLKKGFQDIFSHQQFLRLATDFGFSTHAKPSELSFKQWIGIFNYFITNIDKLRQQKITGAYAKLSKQQAQLQKIHRTRSAKNWRLVNQGNAPGHKDPFK